MKELIRALSRADDETLNPDKARMLLELSAQEQDQAVNRLFLRDLILKYASSERSLIELNDVKNRFLGMAAHDLRNPLASIRGFSDLLLGEAVGPLNEDQREFLALIREVSQDMLALLNDLLDVSVIESGKFSLRCENAFLHALCAERIHLSEVLASKKEIRYERALEEIPDFPFDVSRIGQVVDNLLSNANKFSPRGSTVRISLVLEEENAVFSVRDQGPGVPPREQQSLFGEYQKGSARPTGGEKSTGLGLAIAKRIVEAHGGFIWVKSDGPGATFGFHLPIHEEEIHA